MKPTRRGFLGGLLTGAAATLADVRGAQAASAPDVPEVSARVNGVARAHAVGDDETALDYVRRRCGLTGAKEGCGHGACGACAILVDGTPVASCLLPASHLHGREVRTVESFEPLHPVQRAFMAEDALQCGYCTPGFVVEAVAFHDRWRAANGAVAPSRHDVADALAGHICRCGAYPAIHRAVAAACAGAYDAAVEAPARVEARDKVTGHARFTADIALEGTLEGRILRSPHGAAKITALDLAPALRVPGVRAVVRLVPDAGSVRYAGQELAAVAADDAEAARRGVEAIAVAYEVLTPALGFEGAVAAGATQVYDRERLARMPSANEGPVLGPKRWKDNTRGPITTNFFVSPSRCDRAIDAAGGDPTRLSSGVYRTAAQMHTPMEPRAAVADWSRDAVRLWASTQSVHAIARDVSDRFGVPEHRVHVVATHVGGGFGSKVGLGIEMVAALELSRAAGRPVRVVVDRHEELLVGGYRPACQIEVSVALDAEGELAGIASRALNDAGCAVGSSVSGIVRLMYDTDARRHEDTDLLTHDAPGKPFRAPGGPQAFFALESAVDALAHARGEDPIALRRRFDRNLIRNRLYDQLSASPLWTGRGAVAADTGRYRRGVGMASAAWPYFVSPQTFVRVDATRDGFVVSCATQDMGNGSRTVLAQAVSDALGVPREAITVRVGDSHDVAGPASAGSRTTCSVYPAAWAAAERLAADLAAAAGDQLGLDGVSVEMGGLRHAGGALSWAQVLDQVDGTAVARRPRDPDGYYLPVTVGEVRIGRGLNGGVSACEVEVDTRLGRVRAVRNWTGVGAGKVIVPMGARSQVEGAVVQGISWALYEERLLDTATGRLLTHDLEHYRVMLLGDCPEIEVVLDEGPPWERGPWGPIGIAEVATCAHAAAIANAVHHATG